ncbi:MAG: Bax inhibitor-1/YccA family protein [Bacteroidales bacterium]|nr:Bax inhibitor-1/YccA family protein [Bacteroidales bacterium]
MRAFKSSNPAMRAFEKTMPEASAVPMTIQGTINKTAIMFLLMVFTATITWKLTYAGNSIATTLLFVGLFGGIAAVFATIFLKNHRHITVPIYALFEGLFLGGISAFFNQMTSGIVFQAVILTFAVFAVMLFMYKAKILKASPGFIKGIVMATGGVMLFYIISIVGSFFGLQLNVFNMGPLGIVIQLVIVAIAALNLILDFHFIETGAANGLPKKMEWFAAFGLMVTLVWLYLEILRLIALLNRN